MNGFANKLSEIITAISAGGGDLSKHFNSAIIVAAGNGTRMGPDRKKTKQMTDLCGIPVVVRAVQHLSRVLL